MHRHYRRRRFGGCGPGFRDRPYPGREDWLRSLEEYQKDLEQEVADIADIIRRLKEEDKQGETATV
jgi:hypothetical protein